MFNLLLILVAILPFHAFLITYFNHLFGVETNSLIRYAISSWKEIIILILTLVVILKSWKDKKFPFRFFWFDKLIVIFFLYGLITIFWAESSLNNIFYGLKTDFQFFLVYFIARGFTDKDVKKEKIIKSLLLIGIPIAIFALLQIHFLPPDFLTIFGYSNLTFWDPNFPLPAFQKIPGSDLIRAQATFGGPHQLGSFLLIIALLWINKFSRKESIWKNIIWIIIALIILLAIYYTYARSVWIALLFGIYFLIVTRLPSRVKQIVNWSALIILIIGIILAISVLIKITPEKVYNDPNSSYAQKIHQPTKIEAIIFHHIATSKRLGFFKENLRSTFLHPWGQGAGSTGTVKFRITKDESQLNENWFLEMATAYGFLGFLLYSFVIYGVWKKVLHFPFLSSLFISIFIYSLFTNSMSDMATAIAFWVLIGLSVSDPEQKGKADILGVKIDRVNFSQTLGIIENFIKEKRPHQVVTVNPEFIVQAQKDIKFKKILNQADLSVADGIGLLWADPGLPERVTGVDLTWALTELSSEKKYSIYLLGAEPGVAKKAAMVLQSKYSKLKIWADSGGQLDDIFYVGHPEADAKSAEGSRIDNKFFQDIRSKKPDILLVAFGTPKQEKWIAKHLNKLKIPVVMGVGGTFDFIAGVQKRAPKWMRKISLEWFYRLLRQPRRFHRIWNAVVVFPWLYIFKNKNKKQF